MHHAKNSGKEDDFKERVAELMRKMRPNELHDQITGMQFRHIITTNYDYCIQKATYYGRKCALFTEPLQVIAKEWVGARRVCLMNSSGL